MTLNESNPLVSICIPTYNGQQFLELCLNSAIRQTYRNIEIIIVDDCSTDTTREITKSYAVKDPRIQLYKNEKNLGLVGNWNKCIKLSNGEWIKFLFQDDYLSLDCIEIMIGALSSNDKIVTSGRRLIFDEDLEEGSKNYSINNTLTFSKLGINSEIPLFIPAEKIANFTVKNICINFIGEPTVIMFKKEVTAELGYFSKDLIQICDLEYFLRIATNYGVRYIPQPLTYYRSHKGSTSNANRVKRLFSMIYMDPIITVHQLLYAGFFSNFRKALSLMQKVKLKLFFVLRVSESYKTAAIDPENLKKLEAAVKNYPAISKYRKGVIVTSILLKIVKWRRTFIK